MESGARSDDCKIRLFRSEDASVSLQLTASESGILVERTHALCQQPFICHTILLASRDEFESWLRADPLRFAFPLVFSSAARQVDEWFDIGGA